MSATRRRILITGASSGLGQGMARMFAAMGRDLALCARRTDRLEELRAELTTKHPEIRVVVRPLDVMSYDDVFRTFHAFAEDLGGLDRVIVNAGIGKGKPIGTGYFWANRQTAETNFAENMSIPLIDKVTAGAAQTRGVLLNPKTARALGIAEGDPIVVISRFGRVEGDAALSEGVHPDVVAVSNAVTRRVGGRKGTHFNSLLPGELEYTDNFSGALESVARVRVEKTTGEVAA